MAQAIRFVREHACDPISVADVLRIIPLSRSTLENQFRASLGRTIHAEIQRVQVEQARQLLVHTDLLIKQIAVRCGFKYVPYLTRVFRQHVGLSPGEQVLVQGLKFRLGQDAVVNEDFVHVVGAEQVVARRPAGADQIARVLLPARLVIRHRGLRLQGPIPVAGNPLAHADRANDGDRLRFALFVVDDQIQVDPLPALAEAEARWRAVRARQGESLGRDKVSAAIGRHEGEDGFGPTAVERGHDHQGERPRHVQTQSLLSRQLRALAVETDGGQTQVGSVLQQRGSGRAVRSGVIAVARLILPLGDAALGFGHAFVGTQPQPQPGARDLGRRRRAGSQQRRDRGSQRHSRLAQARAVFATARPRRETQRGRRGLLRHRDAHRLRRCLARGADEIPSAFARGEFQQLAGDLAFRAAVLRQQAGGLPRVAQAAGFAAAGLDLDEADLVLLDRAGDEEPAAGQQPVRSVPALGPRWKDDQHFRLAGLRRNGLQQPVLQRGGREGQGLDADVVLRTADVLKTAGIQSGTTRKQAGREPLHVPDPRRADGIAMPGTALVLQVPDACARPRRARPGLSWPG